MEYGQKLILKKDWKYNKFITIAKGEVLFVRSWDNKLLLALTHDELNENLLFGLKQESRDEYFEVAKDTCTWHNDDRDESDIWNTTCLHDFILNDEQLPKTDAKMNFCCFCGKELVEKY